MLNPIQLHRATIFKFYKQTPLVDCTSFQAIRAQQNEYHTPHHKTVEMISLLFERREQLRRYLLPQHFQQQLVRLWLAPITEPLSRKTFFRPITLVCGVPSIASLGVTHTQTKYEHPLKLSPAIANNGALYEILTHLNLLCRQMPSHSTNSA
jgi:hypothetical protein